ncbi:Uncharacterised protein [Candidatus Tiddalikarchaeum anstoanum]|nr:Uncharacterised protein [Candidatus Tiddalikarchaeum anstoanum]
MNELENILTKINELKLKKVNFPEYFAAYRLIKNDKSHIEYYTSICAREVPNQYDYKFFKREGFVLEVQDESHFIYCVVFDIKSKTIYRTVFGMNENKAVPILDCSEDKLIPLYKKFGSQDDYADTNSSNCFMESDWRTFSKEISEILADFSMSEKYNKVKEEDDYSIRKFRIDADWDIIQ